jgi:hypothetical protein
VSLSPLSDLFLSSVSDIFLAFLVAALFACCMYLRSKICGGDDEEMFSDIQLDEIRLERVSNKERTILGRIDQMKVTTSSPN